MTDSVSRVVSILLERMEASLSTPDAKPISGESAKAFTAAIKTLKEVESPAVGDNRLSIQFENLPESWRQ